MSDAKAKAERLVRKLTGNGCQCYFAIGKPDFQSRMALANFLLLPCLGFMAFRLLRRRKAGRDGEER